MIISNTLNSLRYPDFNYGEFATVSSILETTAMVGKTNNTRYYSLTVIRE